MVIRRARDLYDLQLKSVGYINNGYALQYDITFEDNELLYRAISIRLFPITLLNFITKGNHFKTFDG